MTALGGTVTRNNSIIAGNTGGDESGTGFSGSNNLIGGNPLLAPLGNYGGPTQAMPPLPGSLAIDPATFVTCSGTTLLDQRGAGRVGVCDRGAVESQGFAFSSPTGSGQSTTVGTAFMNPLAVTVTGNIVSGMIREPVDGGIVVFTGPMAGAGIASSPVSVTIPTTGAISDGVASTSVTANSTAGAYSVAASANGATGTATYSLTNTALPNLSINDVTANEGNSGTTSFTVTVSLSSPAGPGGVTFDIATADGTAMAPGDYTAKSLTGQTISAGSSTFSFTVLVNGDITVEGNETLFVNVANVTGATVTDGQGQGTITNDDFAPMSYVVTNALDNANDANCAIASCTLRQAVNASNANNPGAMMQNTITFAAAAFASPQTITLNATFGTLVLSRSVATDGTGAQITVSGGCTGCGAGGGTPMGGVQSTAALRPRSPP